MEQKKAKPFYKSAAWLKCRVFALERDNYLCQPCMKKNRLTPATTVHHKKPLEEAPDLGLDLDNLESICPACHNREHTEKGSGRPRPQPRKVRIEKSPASDERW